MSEQRPQGNQTTPPAQTNPYANVKSNKKPVRKALKAVIWIAVVIVALVAVLFISSYIAGFASVGDMINYVMAQF